MPYKVDIPHGFDKVEKQWAKRYGTDRIAAVRELLVEVAANEAPAAAPS